MHQWWRLGIAGRSYAMAIPAAFEVRLGTYQLLNEDTSQARREMWALFEPHAERALVENLNRSIEQAPFLAETIKRNFGRIVALRKEHMAHLCLRPLDEA